MSKWQTRAREGGGDSALSIEAWSEGGREVGAKGLEDDKGKQGHKWREDKGD